MNFQLEDFDKIDTILKEQNYEESALVAILQDVQQDMNYLPQDVLSYIAKKLDLPLIRIYGLATFYKAFSLKPRGDHLISVCLGTACHVKGGARLMQKLERYLGTTAGEMTRDGRFSLESVRCVGCCGLAPIMIIDEDFYGKMNQSRVAKILMKYV